MTEIETYRVKAGQILEEVGKTVVGKEDVVRKVLMAILAKGHILMEDIPGVGKTTMALTFARVLGIQCNRMQFTPDVMPSDVVGFNMYNRVTNKFEYKEGGVACNLFLADEINRTSPKTQSALLQVMEEGSVTVDGVERVLPDPFMVIATQNPYGSIGTQKLPESQLDRFMISLNMGYPSVQEEIAILKGKESSERIKSSEIVTIEELITMRQCVAKTYVNDAIYEYVANIARESREMASVVQGLSPRGSVAVISMAKAAAFMRGHDYVLPQDVQNVLHDTAVHRIILRHGINSGNLTKADVIDNIIKSVKVPQVK